jgi:chitin synthase
MSFLPDLDTAGSGQLSAGAEAISSSSLEASVRKICSGADLETMTKRNVRRQLEEEYGVDLKSRKDEIGRIIEDVLEGE